MSYGLRIRTPIGELLIDENYSSPQFVGKISVTTGSTQAISEPGYSAQLFPFTYPAGVNSDFLVFWTIPESINDNTFYCFDPHGETAAKFGYGQLLLAIYPNAGGAYSTPEGYVFNLSGLQQSSDQYGLRVRDGNGNIKFDSGTRHIQIQQIVAAYNQSGTSSLVTTTTAALPTKPAFLIATYGAEIWNQLQQGSQQSQGTWHGTAVRRNGTTLTTRSFHLSDMWEDAALVGSIVYGNNSGSLPIINAATFDDPVQGYTPANLVFSYSDYCTVEITASAARFAGRSIDETGEGFHFATPGARVRFATTAPTVLIYLNYTNLLVTSEWYNGTGAVLVNGAFYQSFNRVQGAGAITVTLSFGTSAARTIEVLMPLGASVDFTGAEVTSGYTITAAAARPTTRWVAMGDSITQGYSASQQIYTWTHLLATTKNWQVINHGLGGRPCMPADGTKLASLNPTVASYMIGYNDFNSQTPLVTFKENFIAFVNRFRAVNTTAKLYCITPIWSSNVKTIPLEDYRKQIRDALTSLNNPLNVLVEGLPLMTNSADRLTAGGIHPNDTGSSEISTSLSSIMSV